MKRNALTAERRPPSGSATIGGVSVSNPILDSDVDGTVLLPSARQADELRLGHTIVSLPRFARWYRGAFKSGAGPSLSPVRQALSRVGYYALGALVQRPQLGVATLDVRGESRTLRFDCRNRQFSSLYFAKYATAYEPPVTACLLTLLPLDGVFYDVGSNWGYFSLLAARRREFRGEVHAFEPWAPSYANLTAMVQQTGLGQIIRTHACALAAESGEARMTSGRHSGLARLAAGGPGTAVAKRRLDDLDLPRPDFIKLDVEGFELDVLRGGERTIREGRPVIALESSLRDAGSPTEAVLRLLESWGYRLFIPAICPANVGERPEAEPPLSTERLPDGAWRLALHPVTSRTRALHQEYANILAVSEERWARLAT